METEFEEESEVVALVSLCGQMSRGLCWDPPVEETYIPYHLRMIAVLPV